MLSILLLSASLYQASTNPPVLSLSCYPEKQVVNCYAPSGTLAVTIYVTPEKPILDGLTADLVANAFGTAADLGSTDWAISRGCQEGNPLLPRAESRVAGKIALGAFRGGVAYLLRRAGKDKAAKIFRYAGLGVDLLITGNNIHCGLTRK